MDLIATPTKISDVLIFESRIFSDNRGFFFESFNEKEFYSAIGRDVKFVQDNHSFSKKGVLRGLHYQLNQPQAKLVRVCSGAIFDVVVDMRKSSKYFGQWFGLELSAENKKQLWIPEGFAHGFLALTEMAEVLYKTTSYWHPESEQCILWDDPSLKIAWPNNFSEPILSAKDLTGSYFNSAECYF